MANLQYFFCNCNIFQLNFAAATHRVTEAAAVPGSAGVPLSCPWSRQHNATAEGIR